MALLLISESIFFFMLILAFVYFPSDKVRIATSNLNLTLTTFYTVCLVASSFTAMRAARNPGTRSWLAATIVLGCVFFFGQGAEYLRLIHDGFGIGQNLFGTTFLTLAGIHALHVIAGIVLLGGVLWTAAPERKARTAGSVAMYWHFIDGVWIAIFSVVYLGAFL
ncbi:MAG TPA: cytochrome c oxidase subunit 3 [Bryobacteraceae bacterium]|nr:cytochrome c oxidase subunit 3 [Bryobacteraceae bacterium]